MLGAPQGGVEGKGAGVGEAVQHRPPLSQPGHRLAVVLLVQEKAGLLAVFHVHGVPHAVFHDLRQGRGRGLLAGQGEPALVLLQSLLFPQLHVVALVDAGDGLAVGAQHLYQHGQQLSLDLLHAVGEHLHREQIVEPVHRQAREAVRLAEDDAAAVQVLRPQHGLAVLPGPAELALPEGVVKAVVGVAGEEPHPDFGVLGQKAGAQVASLAAEHIHQGAVFHGAGLVGDFLAVDPGMSPVQRGLRLGRHRDAGIGSCCFHAAVPPHFSFARLFAGGHHHSTFSL